MYGVLFYVLAASGAVLLGLLFFTLRHRRRTRERILIEDALKHLFSCELSNRIPMVESVAGSLNISMNKAAEILVKMHSEGLLRVEANGLRLTPAGRDYAARVIRAHRLWERFLADKSGFVETELHRRADRQEHFLSPADVDALSSRLGHPTRDPHGDQIPSLTGTLELQDEKPLAAMSTGEVGRIVHIEDEPEHVYAELVTDGLHIDMIVRMMEATPDRVRFWAEGGEHVLSPVGAANISIVQVPQDQADFVETLTDLKPGESGKVVNVSRACRRDERRRWMDLGILPGTVIKSEIVSPSGDPTAYRIRGALIALRTEQARLITVRPLRGESA